MPTPGEIVKLVWPLKRDWLRLDTGVKEYSKVSPFYDPMIAKLIVHGDTRSQAIDRMIKVLGELQIYGVSYKSILLDRKYSTRRISKRKHKHIFHSDYAD